MFNFNHERFLIIAQSVRLARVCYEESFIYANKRKTFGKKLIDSGVIRAKLGNMIRLIESVQSWLEMITYQLNNMSHIEASQKLGGNMALLKVQVSQVLEYCAREASQIFGGLGYTMDGQGSEVERIYRDTRGIAILGGSEEIMLDFALRQAMRPISKL